MVPACCFASLRSAGGEDLFQHFALSLNGTDKLSSPLCHSFHALSPLSEMA